MEWMIIAVSSILLGFFSQRNIPNRFGILLPFAFVILLVSLHIAYKLYFYEYSGGGASLWPIILIFQSGFGGVISIFSYFLSQSIFGKLKRI